MCTSQEMQKNYMYSESDMSKAVNNIFYQNKRLNISLSNSINNMENYFLIKYKKKKKYLHIDYY